MRLIDHLRERGMSSGDAKRALESGKVYLGDTPTADATREIDPADVSVRPNAPRVRVGAEPLIVHRDEHLAVVYKPPGLLSVPAASKRGAPSVLGEMSRILSGAHAVHRLDEPTSGLMLVARTEPCQAALKQLFSTHDIERRYLALVWGHPPPEPFTVNNTLVRNRGDGKRGSGEGPDARPAITHIALVERVGPSHALVEARLETGRTHQVRIHLAELGYPVVGDRLYDPRRRSGGRLALHAWQLGFRHPVTDAALSFRAPLADDLERLRRKLAASPGRRGSGGRAR